MRFFPLSNDTPAQNNTGNDFGAVFSGLEAGGTIILWILVGFCLAYCYSKCKKTPEQKEQKINLETPLINHTVIVSDTITPPRNFRS